MGFREYGIDFSPGVPGPRGGGKAPIRILGQKEDYPVGGSTRCRDRGWIRSRQGLPPDPGPSVAAVPQALDLEPAPPQHAQGPVPGRGRCQGRPAHAGGDQAAQAGLLHTGAAGQEPEGGHGQDQPGPVHAGRIRAAHARPRPAHAPGVRKPCSTGPASRRRRGPRPGCSRVAHPRAPWGACSGRGTTGAVPAGGASGSPRAGPAGLAGLAVRSRRLRPSAMGRRAFWLTCGHRPVDQGYPSRFTALNPLCSSLSDSHLPSVPVSVNQAYRNGAHAPLPATRANPQCGRHSVACRSVGQATDRDRTVYTLSNTERLADNPRRQQGRGPRDRRTPADTAHAVAGEDLNTKAGTAAAKGTGAEPGRNLKRKAGRHRSLPARGGRDPERKPDPKAGEPGKANPVPTSQTCSRCGHVHRTHRPSQTLFVCGLRVPGQRRPRWGVIWISAWVGRSYGVRSGARSRGCRTARGRSRGGPPRPVNRMGWKFRQAGVTLK